VPGEEQLITGSPLDLALLAWSMVHGIGKIGHHWPASTSFKSGRF